MIFRKLVGLIILIHLATGGTNGDPDDATEEGLAQDAASPTPPFVPQKQILSRLPYVKETELKVPDARETPLLNIPAISRPKVLLPKPPNIGDQEVYNPGIFSIPGQITEKMIELDVSDIPEHEKYQMDQGDTQNPMNSIVSMPETPELLNPNFPSILDLEMRKKRTTDFHEISKDTFTGIHAISTSDTIIPQTYNQNIKYSSIPNMSNSQVPIKTDVQKPIASYTAGNGILKLSPANFTKLPFINPPEISLPSLAQTDENILPVGSITQISNIAIPHIPNPTKRTFPHLTDYEYKKILIRTP
ncbi:periaxin-like [Macrobrachium rosenbergii]|uniref:periaxin-like n=1 Tax=Macrobrachium rosenbergii TaxID=79674 RepID=UPI0034D653B2